MAIRRKYRCSECGFQFEHMHVDKSEALLTACPNAQCTTQAVAHDVEAERADGEARIQRMLDSGIPPGKSTVRSVALKHAEKAMESMGMTDFNDTGKAGDRAAKTPTPPGAREIQALTREVVEAKAISEAEAGQFAEGAKTFWQGEKKSNGQRPPKLQQHINAAPVAAAVARKEGIDPIGLFHEAGKRGHLRQEPNIVAAVKG